MEEGKVNDLVGEKSIYLQSDFTAVFWGNFLQYLNFRDIQIVLWKISPFCKE